MMLMGFSLLRVGDVAYGLRNEKIISAATTSLVYPWDFDFQPYRVERCQENTIVLEKKCRVSPKTRIFTLKIILVAPDNAEMAERRAQFLQLCALRKVKTGGELGFLLDQFLRKRCSFAFHAKMSDLSTRLDQEFKRILYQNGYEMRSCELIF